MNDVLRGRRRAVPALAAFLLVAALLASCLCSCEGPTRTLRLAASPETAGLLDALIARHPLPRGWKATADNDLPTAPSLGLAWTEETGAAGPAVRPRSSFPLERRWLAAAVDFYDPRQDVGRAEAESLGLVDLDSVELPRRVLEVEGRFPGEKGYCFSQELVLTLDAAPGKTSPRELTAWLSQVAAAEPGIDTAEKPVLLGAVGDIQIGPVEAPYLSKGQAGLLRLFGGILPAMSRPDILVGNLEGSVTDRGTPNPKKRFQFRFPPGTTAALKAAGFDLLLSANNHCFDFGDVGFRDTLADAAASSMPLVGAGVTEAEAVQARPASLKKEQHGEASRQERPVFIGFGCFPTERLGFTLADAAASGSRPGINTDEAATLAEIRRSAASGDFVVVLCHGGAEYRFDPLPSIEAQYRRLIDAGAGLVLGSHPHLLQGAEAHNGGLIAYSLGNFLFTGEVEPPEALKSALLYVLIYRGKARGLALAPIVASYAGSDLDPEPAGTIAAFFARSAAIGGIAK